MSNIIVTLTDEKNTFTYDLEVPIDLEYEKLVDDIAQTIFSYNPDLLYCGIKGTITVPKLSMYQMSKGDTLDSIGVFNGDYIIIG